MSAENQTAPEGDVVAEIMAGCGLSLSQAARRFPSYRESRPVNQSTVFRWITAGVKLSSNRRLRLEAARVGGRWLTSAQAVERFIRAQTPDLDATERPCARTPRQRERAAERAGKQLERIGI
jgi:hypothetical protein